MIFFYVTFTVLIVVLLVGSILEDRRYTQMEQTLKAIIARCGGDPWKAQQYCAGVAQTATNVHIKREYRSLEAALRDMEIERC